MQQRLQRNARQRPGAASLPMAGLAASAVLIAFALGCSEKSATGPTETGPASVTVSVAGGGTTEFLALTQTKQFVAVAADGKGSTEDVTNKALWQSSNVGIAIVSPSGTVTAVGFGSANIRATVSGTTGQLPVAVKNGCLLTLDALSVVYPGGISSYRTVQVTVLPSECQWRAASDVGWLRVSSTKVSSGSGSFSYDLPVNDWPADREGHVVVTASDGSTATHTVRQAAQTCTVVLSPEALVFTRQGGTGRFTVTPSPSDCKWTANLDSSYSAAYVRIDRGSTGQGVGAVEYTAFPNSGSYALYFSIYVQGGQPGENASKTHSITVTR
jgi:hypothetical protein